MFETLKQKIALAIFVFLILSLPVGAYLMSQRQNIKASASVPPSDRTITNVEPSPSISPAEGLKQATTPKTNTTTTEATPAAAVSFGPTLTLKLSLEGRPSSNQAAKIFVGIAAGSPRVNPTYLLSFTIDLPASGVFSGLSLAGLDIGANYSAYIKGPSQIATASAFTMSPTASSLNNGQVITLLSGDLNDDNAVNSADFAIAKNAFGSSQNSTNWNPTADFNADGVVNALDISYIIKNFTKTGESGVWQSTPQGATSSAGLTTASSSALPVIPQGSTSGYWLWVPQGF
jgi:hypothetical protein